MKEPTKLQIGLMIIALLAISSILIHILIYAILQGDTFMLSFIIAIIALILIGITNELGNE